MGDSSFLNRVAQETSRTDAQAQPKVGRHLPGWMIMTGLLLCFGLGMLTLQLLGPRDALARIGSNAQGPGFYLPVDSRQLTVTLQPLLPGARVEATLSASRSKTLATARELTNPAGQRKIAAGLSELYPFSYRLAEPLTLPDDCYDFDRQQYDTSELLDWLKGQVDPASFRTVGLLYADVYDKGYNYLFGQARIAGPVCVVSAARMGGELAGARLSPAQRYQNIVRHELGHTLGLQHVPDRQSVMAFGNSLAELDSQGDTLTRADWDRLSELHPIRWGK